MSIFQISGQIAIEVDDVDIEQFTLNHPAQAKGFPRHLCAMAAALESPDGSAFINQLCKYNHGLRYIYCSEKAKDKILVHFEIVKKADQKDEAHGV